VGLEVMNSSKQSIIMTKPPRRRLWRMQPGTRSGRQVATGLWGWFGAILRLEIIPICLTLSYHDRTRHCCRD